jgi:hypothetical protein
MEALASRSILVAVVFMTNLPQLILSSRFLPDAANAQQKLGPATSTEA